MITYKIYSDIGNREVNEDSVGEQEKDGNYLFILADGLGGHGHGECASNLAVTTSSEMFHGEYFQGKNEKEFLAQCFDCAQDIITMSQKETREYADMKTTMVLLLISGVLGAVILKERIQFTYQGRLPQELGVEDLDLCFLLSNILENAKEAVEKIPLDMGERKIHLTIGTYKNLVFLDCINTILPEEELSAETDKDSEWHGFGIHNIRKIVQKYDGEFELSMEKNTAAAHAALHKNL